MRKSDNLIPILLLLLLFNVDGYTQQQEINYNSSLGNPTLRLYETTEDDWARLQFDSKGGSFEFNNWWTISARANGKVVGDPAPSEFNIFYSYPLSTGKNLLSIRPVIRSQAGITYYEAQTRVEDGDLSPAHDNGTSLGLGTNRWSVVYATNGTIQTSDLRLKKDIHSLSYGLDQIMKLQPVDFLWKSGNLKDKQIGLIAQEVQKIIPEAIFADQHDPDGTLGMNYSMLIPVLINAIQEQQRMISDLQRQVEKL